MNLEDSPSYGMKLYVPGSVFHGLGMDAGLKVIKSEDVAWDFLALGWWEKCHTHWCGTLDHATPRRL